MSKMKTHAERFDEAFKTLLIIMSVTFSGSIAFYKETMEPQFFSVTAFTFIFTISLWAFSTFHGGTREYIGKIVAWYFLMILYGTIFARLSFSVFLLPPLVASVILLISLVLTLQIVRYMKEIIGRKDYRDFMRFFLVVTFCLIVLDFLRFLNLITFLLF